MASGQDELLFGRLAVHYKLITANQLDEVHGLHALAGGRRQLPEILVEMGYLKQRQVEQLLIVQRDYLEKRRAQAAQQAAAATTAPPAPGTGSVSADRGSGRHDLAAVAAGSLPEGVAGPSIGRDSGANLPPLTTFATASAAAAGEPESASTPGTRSSIGTVAVAAEGAREQLDRVLARALERGASDIHLHSGAPIGIRVFGRLEDLDSRQLAPAETARLIGEILDDAQNAALARHGQIDFAYTLPGRARFRGNAYRQQRGLDAVFRAIPSQPPTLLALGLPESLARLADYHQGMVLITGPAGCGKSSTMAALVNIINQTRNDHIVTVEDPIEYIHPSLLSIVNQRQVGPHTASFGRAMRAALREDPDVIAIGELRDLETIGLAITAAETGHLVLATLHTNNAIRTINRMLGVFPPNQQAQMRTMISESLRAVVSQRLMARADGQGRVPALEILIATKAIANLIRDNKTFQIRSALQTGAAHGMVQLDTSLAELVRNRVITREVALQQAEDPTKFPA